jgi:hypothetical protein
MGEQGARTVQELRDMHADEPGGAGDEDLLQDGGSN